MMSFVTWNDNHVSVSDKAMAELGLHQGQQVDWDTCGAIFSLNALHCCDECDAAIERGETDRIPSKADVNETRKLAIRVLFMSKISAELAEKYVDQYPV